MDPRLDRLVRMMFAFGLPKVPHLNYLYGELYNLRTPSLRAVLWQAFILAILLLSWMPDLDTMTPKFDVLDYFAGTARVATTARRMGLASAAIDITYSNNPASMDMTSPQGFACLL